MPVRRVSGGYKCGSKGKRIKAKRRQIDSAEQSTLVGIRVKAIQLGKGVAGILSTVVFFLAVGSVGLYFMFVMGAALTNTICDCLV